MTNPKLSFREIEAACREGDVTAIRRLAESLWANVERRRNRDKSALRDRLDELHALRERDSDRYNSPGVQQAIKDIGRTLAGGDDFEPRLVDHFIFRLVRACSQHGHPPPEELVELIKSHLVQDRLPAGSARRYVAQLEAESLFASELTDAEIARRFRVDRATVGRWRKDFRVR